MNFIDSVLESTKEFEAPRRFYYWAALSSISAVLKDSVFLDMFAYKLYPNIYVLLYGPSGVRKGPAIALADKLVNKVDNTRVINGRASIEAIIKELGTVVTRPGKPTLKDSCGFVVASELSSSIISNPSAMDIMTNLYDRIYNEDEWKYRLKVGESHKLTKPTLTWLAGSNEALFKEFLPEKNIHGGLIGRMFMIAETKPNRLNSLMYRPANAISETELATMLGVISKLKGEYKLEDSVRHEIDKWYVDFAEKKAPLIQDETGFVSRILDFVLKVSMIISAGRRADLEIQISDINEAIEVVAPLIVPTKRVSQIGKKKDESEVSKRGLILTYISNRPDFKCSRKDILQNLGLQVSHEDLDRTMELLLQFDAIELIGGGATVQYRLKTENEKIKRWIERFRQ